MSEFADYLNDQLQSLMIEFGIEKVLASEISSKFISDLRRDFGGEMLYLSSKGQQSHVARRLAIIRDFRSGHHSRFQIWPESEHTGFAIWS